MASKAAIHFWIWAFPFGSLLVSPALAADLTAAPAAPAPPAIAAASNPFDLGVTYVGEIWDNNGGLKTGTNYIYGVDANLTIDAQKLFGLQGGKFYIEGFYVGGKSQDLDYTSALAAPSPLDAYGSMNLAKLYQLYYEQPFGATDILVGKYDLQQQFGTTAPMSLFGDKAQIINDALAAEGYAVGLNGPSEYPNTAVGLRVKQTFNNQWSVSVGLLDGEADSPVGRNATDVEIKNVYGALGIGEVDYTPDKYTKLMAGVWGETGQLDKMGQYTPTFAPVQTWGEAGGYVGGATRLYTIEGSRGVDGFFNIGVAPGDTNIVSGSVEGGLTFTGLIGARPKDQLGVAVAVTQPGSGFRALELLGGTHLATYETDYEATYRAKITDWLVLQPEADYIVHPSIGGAIGGGPLKNAFVFGLHFELHKEFN
jgi:porin